MRNKVEKFNMTKFDYVSRKLAIFGLFVMIFTIAIGGSILIRMINENKYLTNVLSDKSKLNDQVVKNKNGVEYIVDTGDYYE